MPTYIAFLRSVNLAGRRTVPMAELRTLLTDNGFADVETYINSGNVRFTSPMRSAAKVSRKMESLLAERFGFEVPTILRTPAQLNALAEAVADLPSPLEGGPRRYVAFLSRPPSADGVAALDSWSLPDVRAKVVGSDVVIWLSVGAHESSLTAARMDRLTGAVSTARDMKVVLALAGRWA